MAIYLPRRRASQPQFPARIDRANSLTDKIEFLHTSASLLDLTRNGYDLDKHVNVVNLPHNGESAWITSATAGEDMTFKKGISFAVGEDFTMLVRVKLLPQGAEDTTGGCMVLRDGTSGTPIIGIYVGANGATTSANRVLYLVRDSSGNLANAGTTPPLINDGKTHTVALKRYSNTVYWSVDGSAWASFGAAPTQAITITNPSAMNYGNDTQNGAIGNLNAAFSLGALWRRSLSDLEVKRLHFNPWQLLKRGQTLHVGVASVGVTEADANSAGTGVATGVSGATAGSAGGSVGTAAASGAAAAVAPSIADTSGTGAATGVAAAIAPSVAASAGLASSSGIGTTVFASVASSAGTSTASADAENAGAGATIIEADASASGTSSVTGVSSSTSGSVAESSGVAEATVISGATVGTVGTASGAATVNGIGADGSAVEAVTADTHDGGGWLQPVKRHKQSKEVRKELERLFHKAEVAVEKIVEPVEVKHEPRQPAKLTNTVDIGLPPLTELQMVLMHLRMIQDEMTGQQVVRLAEIQQEMDRARMYNIRARAALLAA